MSNAEKLFQLHHSGNLLVFPNVWDPLSALLMEDLGYPALATASAAIAYANGYDDGENIPFADYVRILRRITECVGVPVSADVESGFAQDLPQLEQNIKQLIEAGVAGINLEDTNAKTAVFYTIEEQCERIRVVKATAKKMGTSLFVNARTDTYLNSQNFTNPEAVLTETLKRGNAYKEAGADCFFPILMQSKKEIEQTVNTLQMPVNIFAFAGIPDLETLQSMGVARLSVGPSMLKFAMASLKKVAQKLLQMDGLEDLYQSEVSSAYLKTLVTTSENKKE